MSAVQKTLRTQLFDANLWTAIELFCRGSLTKATSLLDFNRYNVAINTWEHMYDSVDDVDLGIGRFCGVHFKPWNPVFTNIWVLNKSLSRCIERCHATITNFNGYLS